MKIGTGRSHHSFDQLPVTNIPRSAFNLSHGYKTAFDSGYLVPFFSELAYPGDTFNVKANCFARLSTPVVPFMDNLYLDTFWFAVPWRLVWNNFQKFMGEQANPGDSTSYVIPQSTSPVGGYSVGSLHDYFGLPTVGQVGAAKQVTHNNLMLRAYNLIWNEWFRDENMQNSVTVDKGDGPDTYSNYTTLKRGKRKDYFTGALPWPQKGTSVSLPLGTSAPVVSSGSRPIFGPTSGSDTGGYNIGGSVGNNAAFWSANAASSALYYFGATTGLQSDLSTATAATINQLRQAIQLQGMYERDARGGTRYTEIIRSHFGVISADARLQRPEYLGGSSTPIKINPVVQTSNTPASGTPQGNLAAYGIVGTHPNGFVKSFTEHCLIIGLVSVRAELSYQQGLEKQWTYQTRSDLYWPSLAMIGEQAVLTKEIYCTGDSANDDVVFGYQERYGEMRYKQSKITGIMRSTASGTVDVWHLSQKFTSAPTLGDTFISENPPISRVVAVNTEPQFIFDSYIDFKAVRPMPTYGIPGSLMRF